MSDDAGPNVDEVDSVLAEVDKLIAERARYRAALGEVASILEPALDATKLGTPTARAMRAALEVARRAREDAGLEQ